MEGPDRKKRSLPAAGSFQTLLICSSHELAVEISYHRGDAAAPFINLRAKGLAARQAEQLAIEQGRRLVHDEVLARQLYRTSTTEGEPIDPACYRQVARYWSN
jgi:flagellar biosynthesis protein FlhB